MHLASQRHYALFVVSLLLAVLLASLHANKQTSIHFKKYFFIKQAKLMTESVEFIIYYYAFMCKTHFVPHFVWPLL